MIKEAKIKERAATMGNKAANLIELNKLFNNVPPFIPLDDGFVKQHLDQYAPTWQDQWMTFKTAQADERNELKSEAIAALHSLREQINKAFQEHIIQNEDLNQFLETLKKDGIATFMVRSTGEEDTLDVANPGGNESIFNVEATPKALSSAIGRVVASYFSEKSLKQRLLSSQNNITESVFIPVMVQRMIGESKSNIIRSGVMYTHSDMTCIQAAPGIAAVTDSTLPFDTFFVTGGDTIYSEIAQKTHRFTPQGNELLLNLNPPELKKNAALPPEVILRLATMGRKIEQHYGMAMDVEFIYEPQKDMIYLVQARPIPTGSVKQVVPSAIAPEKMAMIKEEIKNNSLQALKAHVVSTGGNAAKVINQHEQLLLCETAQDALNHYLKQKNSPVQAVIVKEIPPDMSHHVAQLNANGIPVLQTNDLTTLRDWVASKNWPIVIDVQRGLIIDWSQKIASAHNPKQALFDTGVLKEGLFAHPLRPLTATSLKSMRHGKALKPFLQETHKKIMQANALPIQKEKIFSQLLDCIEAIEAVQTGGENTKALQALNTTRKLFYRVAKLFHKKNEVPAFFAPAMVACDDIMQCLQTAPLNYPYLLKLTAKLSSLATYPGAKTIFSDSILQAARESKAIKKALAQPGVKRLTPEELSYFTQFLKLEVLAVSPVVKKTWRKFIFDCVQDTKSTQSLAQMITFYRQHRIESDWLHFSFANAIRQEYSLQLLEEEFLITKKEIETLKLNTWQNLIQYWESQIQAWENPAQFDALSANYEKDMQALITELTSERNLKPLSKKALFASVHALTDMMDRTIKSLKGSPEYKENIDLQVERFAKLLNPYHLLMQRLMRTIPDEQYMIWSRNGSDNYNNRKEPMLKAIEDKFAKCRTNLGPEQLNASGAFSVNAVRIGSTASFARQFVNAQDITLEDLFTLTHQNILFSIQQLTKDTWMPLGDLPEVFQPFLEQVKGQRYSDRIILQLLDIKYQHPSVELEYNIPLRNHSAKCFLKYNQSTERMEFKFQIYGMNWANRMNVIATLAHIEGKLLDTDVKQVPRYSDKAKTMELTWEFTSKQIQESASLLIGSIKQYCRMTEYISSSDGAEKDLFKNAEELFLRHPDVMKKIALFLRFSKEERKNYPWIERALLWNFIVGASEPDTQLACQEILKGIDSKLFQGKHAISSLLSFLPYYPSDAEEQLKKRIITIINYYLNQGASLDPSDHTILKTVSLYPELSPPYLKYLKTHQNDYRGTMSIDDIMILSKNQHAISEMVRLEIIDSEKLQTNQLNNEQLSLLLQNPSLKERLLTQLYENSRTNQEPNIKSLSSYILDYNPGHSAESNIVLLVELLTNPLYKPFIVQSFQTRADFKSYNLFDVALKKNQLELCKLFLQAPQFANKIPHEMWPAVLEQDELRELVFNHHTFALDTKYDNFFHEKLFTSLKYYLDSKPLMCTKTQLIKLLQWKDKEKQLIILGHPNFSWKKSSLVDSIKTQISLQEKEIQENPEIRIPGEFRRKSQTLESKLASLESLKSKLKEINEFWIKGDEVSSDYALRELFFKSEWIPNKEELSYVDYVKYQYDTTHSTPLPRLSEAIKTGDVVTIKYYLNQKIPDVLAKYLIELALSNNQLPLAHYLITQEDYALNTSYSWELFYLAAQNGDIVFWQHLLDSKLFEKLPNKICSLESVPANESLIDLYYSYEPKEESDLLGFLIEHGKKDIVMLILQSKKFVWPFSNEEQEKLIVCIENSGDNELIEVVLKKLNLTSEERVFLSQSVKPLAKVANEEKETKKLTENSITPVKMSIKLIQDIYQEQQPKNEVGSEALAKLKQKANQKSYQNINSISLDDYQALQQSYKDYLVIKVVSSIEAELNTLKKNIGRVDAHHFPEAEKHAQLLLKELEQHKTQYQKTLENLPQSDEQGIQVAGEQFDKACKESINKARPILERDLSWGDYLNNLAKTLGNAIIKIATLGYASSFFSMKKSQLLDVVDKMEQNLKSP